MRQVPAALAALLVAALLAAAAPAGEPAADALLQAGRAREAAVAYRALLNTAPDDPRLLLKTAQALLQAGQPAAALPFVERVLQREAQNAPARLLRARCLQELRRWDDALNDYLQVLVLTPDDPQVHLGIAYIYLAQQQPVRARQELQAALAAGATGEHAARARWFLFRLATGEPAAALSHLRAALPLSERWTESEYRTAYDFLKQHAPAEAVLPAEKLWTRARTAENALRLAEAYRAAGRTAEAVPVLRAVPGMPAPVAQELTGLLMAQNDAAGALDAALQWWQASGDPSALAQAAEAAERAGNMPRALSCHAELLRRAPTPARLRQAAATALAAGDAARARAWAFDAAARAANDADNWRLAARAADAAQDAAGAVTARERLLALAWDADAAAVLAEHYLLTGRGAEAEAVARRLSSSGDARGDRVRGRRLSAQGRELLQQGRLREALTCLEAAVLLTGGEDTTAAVKTALGEVRLRLGDTPAAAAALTQAGGNAHARLLLSDIALAAGDTPAYVRALRGHFAAGGSEARALLGWAELLRQVGDARAAADYLAARLNDSQPELLVPLAELWLETHEPARAAAVLARAARLPAPPPPVLRALLRAYLAIGDLFRAEQAAQRLAALGDGSPAVRRALAAAALQRGDAATAAQLAYAALAIAPRDDGAARLLLAEAQAARGYWRGVAAVLRGGMVPDAERGRAALLLAQAELVQKHYPEAVAAFAKARAAGATVPAAAEARALRGAGNGAAGGGRLAEAETLLARAEAVQPTAAGALRRGQLALARGDAAAARALWEAGCALRSDDDDAPLLLALARREAPAQALTRLRQLPRLTAAQYAWRAALARQAGDSSAAVADLREAWARGEQHAAVALALAELAPAAEAAAHYAQAQRLAPDSPAVYAAHAAYWRRAGAAREELNVAQAARAHACVTPALAAGAVLAAATLGDDSSALQWSSAVTGSAPAAGTALLALADRRLQAGATDAAAALAQAAQRLGAEAAELLAAVALLRGDEAGAQPLLARGAQHPLPQVRLAAAALRARRGEAAAVWPQLRAERYPLAQWPSPALLVLVQAGEADSAVAACRVLASRRALPPVAELAAIAARGGHAPRLYDTLITLAPSETLFAAAVDAARAAGDTARARWLAQDAAARFPRSRRAQDLLLATAPAETRPQPVAAPPAAVRPAAVPAPTAAACLARAQAHAAAGAWERARAQSWLACLLDPAAGPAWLVHGNASLHAGATADGIAALQQARLRGTLPVLDTGVMQVLLVRGEAAVHPVLDIADLQAAAQVLRSLHAARRDDPATGLLLAGVLQRRGETAAAAELTARYASAAADVPAAAGPVAVAVLPAETAAPAPVPAVEPAAAPAATADIARLEEAVAARPDDDQLRVRLAESYAAAGETARAAAAVEAALARRRSAPALALAAQLAGEDRDWQAAAQLLGEALRLQPSDFSLHFRLAAALQHDNRLPEALRHAQLAVTNAPDSAAHKLLGDIAAALDQPALARAQWQQALARGWPDDAAFRLARGSAAVSTGDAHAAIAELAPLAQADPENAWAQLQLGEAWLRLGALDAAAPCLQRAAQSPVETIRQAAQRLQLLACVQTGDLDGMRALLPAAAAGAGPALLRAVAERELRQGDPARAFALLAEQCRTLPPDSAPVTAMLLAGERAGQHAAAVRRGQELAPYAAGRGAFHAALARLFARLGQRDAALLEAGAAGPAAVRAVRALLGGEAAATDREQAFLAAPWGTVLPEAAGEAPHPVPGPLLQAYRAHGGVPAPLRGTFAVLLGRAGLYRDALALLPETDAYNRGWLLCQAGDYQAAEACWEEEARRRPQDADLHNNLGVAALRRGDLDTALRRFATAVRLAPAAPGVLLNFARALRRAGRSDEALQLLQRAAATGPEAAVRVELMEVLFARGDHRAARRLADELQTVAATDLQRRVSDCLRALDRLGA